MILTYGIGDMMYTHIGIVDNCTRLMIAHERNPPNLPSVASCFRGLHNERGLHVTSLRNTDVFLGLVPPVAIDKTRNSSTG